MTCHGPEIEAGRLSLFRTPLSKYYRKARLFTTVKARVTLSGRTCLMVNNLLASTIVGWAQ